MEELQIGLEGLGLRLGEAGFCRALTVKCERNRGQNQCTNTDTLGLGH